MAKAKKVSYFKIFKQNLLSIVLFFVLLVLTTITYQLAMANKYYPVTLVGDTNISFLTKGQAIKAVDARFQKRAQQKLQFEWAQGSFTLDLATSSASLDYSALEKGFNNTHTSPFVFFTNSKINPKVVINLDKQLDNTALAVNKEPQDAKLIFNETPAEATSSSQIQITDSVPGFTLDKDQMKRKVESYLLSGKYSSSIPLKTIPAKVTTQHVIKAKTALDKLASNPIRLVFDNQNWFIDIKQLLTLLDLETGQDNLLNKDKAAIYLKSIASEIDQEVVEGLFEFNPETKRVTAFKPSQEGRKLDIEATYQQITAALTHDGSKTINLPVAKVLPKIQTEDVNSLGIKELLGRGISHFAGSIPNRIYNIALTASKINGVLVAPSQIFSFNRTVGDISAATGFRQAYVIKEGRTVLDDGGGVCQDSTTLFRAVLNAGLPIIQRTAHVYRVGYYEQGFPPGLDATVYYPSVDFQFKNDTPAHILIQAYTSGTILYVDLYGTSDGREVNLSKPVITNQTPPPPELRQDDPTLPRGTVKQVDWSAWGASVSFKRIVTRGEGIIASETWRSNYKPWQAVYLVGTQ
ncbi:VanW family protein [Candidatus Daviesbacteria bacterium]|nr:VanW family protein [Candidatus Daviesbacteria bacterium]